MTTKMMAQWLMATLAQMMVMLVRLLLLPCASLICGGDGVCVCVLLSSTSFSLDFVVVTSLSSPLSSSLIVVSAGGPPAAATIRTG
jgi:hypothetical protein